MRMTIKEFIASPAPEYGYVGHKYKKQWNSWMRKRECFLVKSAYILYMFR